MVWESGAVTACIYDRYVEKSTDLKEIRTRLAQMESFFHGKSSGIDPWVSYSQQTGFSKVVFCAIDEDKIRTFTEMRLSRQWYCTKHKIACRTFSSGAKKMKGWEEMVDLSNTLAQSFSLQHSKPLKIQESMHRQAS